ncbi:MAG: hypothetical protein JNN01_01660 [Opitutaceae bacterium]|nr:hypothetical protein [Opitutaceae bacterium]
MNAPAPRRRPIVRLPLPAQRYVRQLARFEQAVQRALVAHRAQPALPVGDHLYRSDGRTPLFYLQGLARLTRAMGPGKKRIEPWLGEFKEIEDRLGAYDYWVVLEHNALDWGVDPAVSAYLAGRRLQALGALEYALGRFGWLTYHEGAPAGLGPMPERLREYLSEAEWLSPKRERRRLAEFLHQEAEEIQDDLNSGRLQLSEVEAGVHELRRKLRWIPIYGHALGGKVVLDTAGADGALAHYVTPDQLKSRFNRLPRNAAETKPLKLHRGAFLAIGRLIAEIGVLKDRALWTEELTRICRVVKADANATLQRMGPTAITPVQLVAQVSQLVDRILLQDGALRVLANHLKDQD